MRKKNDLLKLSQKQCIPKQHRGYTYYEHIRVRVEKTVRRNTGIPKVCSDSDAMRHYSNKQIYNIFLSLCFIIFVFWTRVFIASLLLMFFFKSLSVIIIRIKNIISGGH